MGLSDSSKGSRDGYWFPSQLRPGAHAPWPPAEVSQVPGSPWCWRAALSTPGSPATACDHRFMSGAGFVISGILATPIFAFRGLERFTGVAAHQLAFQGLERKIALTPAWSASCLMISLHGDVPF